ncbi:MAG: terminase gpA endonuclease subunit, partial [Kiritimatiellia bacterium]
MINGEPFNLSTQPFLEQIYADLSRHIVVMKAAQMGISEYAINKSIWFLENCGDVLYVLPTDGDSNDFSAGRLNPAIEESPHVVDLFTDVANVGHKRSGNRNYYLRGSNSRSRLKSVPIDFLVLDEFEEMVQKNIPLARDRMDASPYKWELNMSTPGVPEAGIDAEFAHSDQHKWLVRCEHCNYDQELTFPDNIAGDEYVCRKCRRPIDRFHGQWVAARPGADIRGYHLSQLFSPTVTAAELMKSYALAISNQHKLADFYNSKLGLPYVPEGHKLEKSIVLSRRGDKLTAQSSEAGTAMGVDVGALLHCTVSEPG